MLEDNLTSEEVVFQCGWCGEFVSTEARRLKVCFVPQRDLDDGRLLVRYGVFCSPYCAERSTLIDTNYTPDEG